MVGTDIHELSWHWIHPDYVIRPTERRKNSTNMTPNNGWTIYSLMLEAKKASFPKAQKSSDV